MGEGEMGERCVFDGVTTLWLGASGTESACSKMAQMCTQASCRPSVLVSMWFTSGKT